MAILVALAEGERDVGEAAAAGEILRLVEAVQLVEDDQGAPAFLRSSRGGEIAHIRSQESASFTLLK